MYLWVGGANFCAANFARLFLDTKHYSRKVENALWYGAFYGIGIAILANFLSFPVISRIVIAFNPFYTIFLVTCGAIIWWKGNPYARYHVFAWSAYIGGLIVIVLHTYNIVQQGFIVAHALQISTLVEIVLLSLAMSYKYKVMNEESQANKLKIQAFTYERKLKEEENKFLQEKIKQEQSQHEENISFKERELTIMTMQLLEKNTFLQELQKQIESILEISNTTDLKKISKSLQENINLANDWEKFRLHFEQVHPNLLTHLSAQFQQLTTNDLKIIAYIRINFSTKEISKLLNIDDRSVKMVKYRLKKKLNLKEDDNLDIFIRTYQS